LGLIGASHSSSTPTISAHLTYLFLLFLSEDISHLFPCGLVNFPHLIPLCFSQIERPYPLPMSLALFPQLLELFLLFGGENLFNLRVFVVPDLL
jgi:hypothetical protein